MRPLSGGACVLATITALLVDCGELPSVIQLFAMQSSLLHTLALPFVLVALQIEPFSANGVIEPGADGQFFDFVNVRCFITDPPADLVTRWIYGPSIYTNSSTSDRHIVTFHPDAGATGILNLEISNIGYADNGTYVCQARSAANDTWMWASVELVLQG